MSEKRNGIKSRIDKLKNIKRWEEKVKIEEEERKSRKRS